MASPPVGQNVEAELPTDGIHRVAILQDQKVAMKRCIVGFIAGYGGDTVLDQLTYGGIGYLGKRCRVTDDLHRVLSWKMKMAPNVSVGAKVGEGGVADQVTAS